MKLKWVELHGMRYVEDYEDDHNHCARCAFYGGALDKYCEEIKKCNNIVFIPLEPQHIPNLRKVGKTL